MTEESTEQQDCNDIEDNQRDAKYRKWWLIGGVGFLVVAIIVMVSLALGYTNGQDDELVSAHDDAPAADEVVPNAAESYGEGARSSMTQVTDPDENIHEPYHVPEEVTVDAAGYTMKEFGESGQLTAGTEGDTAAEEDVLYSIAVEDVTITDQCKLRAFEQLTEPEGEHFVMVDVTASVEEDIEPYIEADIEDYYMPLVHDAFALLDEDGELVEGYTETAYGCLDLDQRLDAFIDAGDEVSGTIVFDVQELPERIAYDPQDVGGWSWEVDPA